MSRGAAEQPKNLAAKLREIRLAMGMTQEAMADALIAEGAKIHSGYVSLYETQRMNPSLLVVLAYAQVARISTDYLINDNLDLPTNLPAKRLSKIESRTDF